MEIMREKLVNLLGGLLFCAVLCGLGGLEDYIKTSYTREATVIDYYEDVCCAKDSTGNIWHFIGDGYEVGDKVKLYMNTNHTDSNILDDTITKVKMIKGE